MAYALIVVVPPAEQPVTVEECKRFLHWDNDDEDNDFALAIQAETERCERVTGLSLVTRTLRLATDGWHTLPCYLPYPPLQSVTGVRYIDSTGALVILATTEYQVDALGTPGRLLPAYGVAWPSVLTGTVNAVQVTYTAGFGSASAVPEAFKNRIRQNVGWVMQNRETVDDAVLDRNYAALGYGSYP